MILYTDDALWRAVMLLVRTARFYPLISKTRAGCVPLSHFTAAGQWRPSQHVEKLQELAFSRCKFSEDVRLIPSQAEKSACTPHGQVAAAEVLETNIHPSHTRVIL